MLARASSLAKTAPRSRAARRARLCRLTKGCRCLLDCSVLALQMLLDVEKVATRWIAHCVEEFGTLEQFMPALFHAAQRASV